MSRLSAAPALGALALAAVACSQLIGIQDYGESGGASSSATSATSATSSTTAQTSTSTSTSAMSSAIASGASSTSTSTSTSTSASTGSTASSATSASSSGLPPGSPCAGPGECSTGICALGSCCTTACGFCEECFSGVCNPQSFTDDFGDCGPATCAQGLLDKPTCLSSGCYVQQQQCPLGCLGDQCAMPCLNSGACSIGICNCGDGTCDNCASGGVCSLTCP